MVACVFNYECAWLSTRRIWAAHKPHLLSLRHRIPKSGCGPTHRRSRYQNIVIIQQQCPTCGAYPHSLLATRKWRLVMLDRNKKGRFKDLDDEDMYDEGMDGEEKRVVASTASMSDGRLNSKHELA